MASNRIIIGRDEQRVIPLLWTGAESDLSYEITLAEPGASVQLLGLLIGSEAQSLNLQVTIIHAAPKTTSNVLINAALKDNAKTDINGLLRILPRAIGSNTWLGAHILLSDNAKGVAVPALEILENDIIAGHATTVGRIDELQVFYLMCRGLTEATARKLIMNGFMQSIIERFPAALAARAQELIAV